MSKWKYVGNTTNKENPLWNEYVNEDTGESTLSVHTPLKISRIDTCNHYFEFAGNDAICRKCGWGQPIILGMQIVRDGKIKKMKKGDLIR